MGLSGKDGALLRARRIPVEDGRSKEHVGEVTRVNHEFLEMLLGQGYVPIISPVGLGEDGQTYDLGSDAVAAEVASALKAHKLIYLHDAPGILRGEELFNELHGRAAGGPPRGRCVRRQHADAREDDPEGAGQR